MATIWLQNSDAVWRPVPLASSDGPISMAGADLRPFRPPGHLAGSKDRWAVFGGIGSCLRVNGEPVALGIRVLSDRDALFAEDGSVSFFSEEEPAQVVAFPGFAGGRPGTCARCRNPITVGELAVNCPGCGAWTHQSEEFPCWTYEGAETCPLCDQPNIIGAYRWAPDHDGW